MVVVNMQLYFGPTQRLADTAQTAEAEYSINFSEQQKNFYLSLHYNGVDSYLFLNGVEIDKFKANYSKINAALLCLLNVSKRFSADNIKIIVLYGYVFDFSINYDSIDDDNTLDTHKYLMVKISIK